MFFLKKLLSRFLFPVPVCAGFLLLGLALWFLTKRKKLGRSLVVSGTVLLLLLSYPWLPRYALWRLERQYPVLTEDGGRGAGYVMVLGTGFSADIRRPPAARFGDEMLQRIVEGVRLHRLLTNSTLLVSVAGPAVSQPEKEQVFGELLAIFGLRTNAVQVCAEARDTEDEITWCRRVVGTNRLVIVSSASHLPRAMVLARRHGLHAIPAPSGFLVDTVTPRRFSPAGLFPSSVNLYYSERAMNEYLGLAWERLRGTRRTEDGGRRTEDGGRRTEDGRQMTECEDIAREKENTMGLPIKSFTELHVYQSGVRSRLSSVLGDKSVAERGEIFQAEPRVLLLAALRFLSADVRLLPSVLCSPPRTTDP